MKKTIFIFIFFLILVSKPVYAEYSDGVDLESTESIPIPTGSITPEPTPSLIDYTLPYPGVLPGSPLYTVKMVRDKFMEILISDPVKKSNFYILQADKRLGSALLLFEKGDEEAAYSALSKGQKYLEKSLAKAIEAREKKFEIGDIFDRVRNSAAKQKQEIKILIPKHKGQLGKQLEEDYKKAENIEKRAIQLKP